MRLDCYALQPSPPALVAARPARRWMDTFPDRHAYRCLPLSIANCYGWELLSPANITIHWNGGPDACDIRFECDEPEFPLQHFVMSNFTRGIVTFHTGYIFQTDPHWNLLAGGPLNEPKDGISPLSGVVETDWLPYPFTMNWQLTRPGVVRFDKGEPFCHILPVPARALESFEPRILELPAVSELGQQYAAWRDKRTEFMQAFRAGDPATLKAAWQKFYFKGELPDQSQPTAAHVQKLRLAEPVDLRSRHDPSVAGASFASARLAGWHVQTATGSASFAPAVFTASAGDEPSDAVSGQPTPND